MKYKDIELPVYDAYMIEDNEELGMEKISLVKDPANRIKFMAFSEVKAKTKILLSEDRQLVTCALMQPDDLIYRNQDGQEFYIKYSVKTIEQMVHKFMKGGDTGEINIEHSKGTKGVHVVEIACVDSSRGLKSPEGLDLKDGSAWCTLKIDNPEIWASVKDKTFEGISLEGMFGMRQEFSTDKTNSNISVILDTEQSYKVRHDALIKQINNK